MAESDEKHNLVLAHFEKDVNGETYVCKHCSKRYRVNSLGTHLTNCKALSPCDSFFHKLKPVIWSIQIQDANGTAVGTGFSVSNDGLIMTAAHLFGNVEELKKISAHTIDRKLRKKKVKLVHCRPEADLALLKAEIDNCESVELRPDVWLSAGDEIMTVGVSACLLGHAFFGCTEIKEIKRNVKGETYKPKLKCEYYKPKQSIQKYRTLGDVYNLEYFKVDPCKYIRNYNPFVPIIQGQLDIISGNSGSPVFNMKREVVGMVHGCNGPDSISIHVSELVDFLDEYIRTLPDPPSTYATKIGVVSAHLDSGGTAAE